MTVSDKEVTSLDTPYDEDTSGYPETYDDDPVVQLLRQNFHDYLGIKHSMTVTDLYELAWNHLDVFFRNSLVPDEESEDPEFDEARYIYYLEMCFVRLFQDVAILSKMLMPSNLGHNQEFASFHPAYNNNYIAKLGFNVINNPEINEYPYPKFSGPNATYSADAAFRASNENELDIISEALQRLPDHWKKSVTGFLERTAEFLYGSVDAFEKSEAATTSTDIIVN